MMNPWHEFWKDDWDQTRERFTAWWQHEGLIVHVLAPRKGALDAERFVQVPFFYLQSGLDTRASYASAEELDTAWLDPARRVARAERYLSGMAFAGEAFPYFDTHLGRATWRPFWVRNRNSPSIRSGTIPASATRTITRRCTSTRTTPGISGRKPSSKKA